jgi:hypothetical protein
VRRPESGLAALPGSQKISVVRQSTPFLSRLNILFARTFSLLEEHAAE